MCVPTLRPPLGVAGSGEQGGPVTGTSSQHVAGAEAEQVIQIRTLKFLFLLKMQYGFQLSSVRADVEPQGDYFYS